MELEAKGTNGQVHFDGTFVRIKRKGILARGTVGKGEKSIPIGSITSVQWKEPGAFVNGYIQFVVPGANEPKGGFGKQTFQAVDDENSIIVSKKAAAAFLAIRDAVEGRLAEMHATPAGTAPASGVAAELQHLNQLRADGILTDEEFEAQKAKLLG